jgi:hypothetical protein
MRWVALSWLALTLVPAAQAGPPSDPPRDAAAAGPADGRRPVARLLSPARTGERLNPASQTSAQVKPKAKAKTKPKPKEPEAPKAPATDDPPKADDDPAPPRDGAGALSMTPAVVCSSVRGYEDYTRREDSVFTKDEKLVFYFQPQGFTIEEADGEYLTHIALDLRLRRKGARTAVWTGDDVLERRTKTKDLPGAAYFTAHVGLKEMPPGDYELDIILRDLLAPGTQAKQVLPFQVKKPLSPLAPRPKGK